MDYLPAAGAGGHHLAIWQFFAVDPFAVALHENGLAGQGDYLLEEGGEVSRAGPGLARSARNPTPSDSLAH